MQEREFDKLLNLDHTAMWASLEKEQTSKLNEMLNLEKEKRAEIKEEIRQEIEKNEEEIPAELTKDMHLFIKAMQDKGLSKRNVRRAFERKFNVKIV